MAVVAVCAVWAALWALGRALIVAGIAAGAQGTVQIAASAVTGFPLRYDIALKDVSYSHAPISAAAPAAHISAPFYAPWHMRAGAPALHIARVQGLPASLQGNIAIDAQLRPMAGLPMRRLHVTGADLGLVWGVQRGAIKSLQAQLRAAPFGAQMTLSARGITLPLPASAQGSALVLDDVQLNFDLHYDGALAVLRAPPARASAVIVHHLSANTAAGQISITANLAPDSAGLVSGSAQITLSDVAGAVRALRAGGVITPQTADTMLRAAGAGMGGGSVGADSAGGALAATLPLRLQFGQIWLGFIPLGPAPLWPL